VRRAMDMQASNALRSRNNSSSRYSVSGNPEAELWYFGNMFVTESNDGYVVVDDVDGTMQQEALGSNEVR